MTTHETMTDGQAAAIAMNRDVQNNTQDLNNVLATSKKVNPWHQLNYTNMDTEQHGCKNLILEIMQSYKVNDESDEGEIYFPAGIEQTVERPIAIACSMFTEQIHAAVMARFTNGSDKYPLKTIKHNLGEIMLKKDKTVGKIQLTGDEDKDRKGARPRCKWYLIQ